MCVDVCMCVCVCVNAFVCQLREALEAREAELLAESRRIYDTLDHTIDDRVTCCKTLSHMTRGSVAAAQGLAAQHEREGHASAHITLLLARAELDALVGSSVAVVGNVGGVEVRCDGAIQDTVNVLCRAIGEIGNVVMYREEAVVQQQQQQHHQQQQQQPVIGDVMGHCVC